MMRRANKLFAETHRVALLGFGTVGKGFCEIVKKKKDVLANKYKLNIEVVAVSDFMKGSIYCPDGLDVGALLEHDAAGKSLSEFTGGKSGTLHQGWDGLKTCSDTNAATICEQTFTNLTDGTPAISHVETALTAGKNVVTTNKGPVVFAYDKLDALARSNKVRFMIEGAIMSGTPIVSLMKTMPAMQYSEISGILNGTCNYMLTRMEDDGISFEEALKDAQDLGYAEADPSFDIGGGDARAKTIILTRILKDPFDMDKISLEGIEGITLDMVQKAKAEGKRYKLLSKLLMGEDGMAKSIAVGPEAIPITHPLAGVGAANNALNFKSDMLGNDLCIQGPGAGKIETGYSLFTDLMYLADSYEKEP